MTTSRRGVLIGAAALAAIGWSWQRFGVQDVNFAFAPIPGLPGWQVGQAGELTTPGGNATSAVFLGIGEETVDPLPPERLCDALYRAGGNGTPVAVFTDAFCPNCRIMDPMLAAREDLAITWHDLPLLGPNSERVARALVAAELQGKGTAFRKAVSEALFRPGPRFFTEAAEQAGIDGERLLEDLESEAVTQRLAETRAAAETLGVWGTPAIAIGQTLVMGRLDRRQLDRLLERPLGNCS